MRRYFSRELKVKVSGTTKTNQGLELNLLALLDPQDDQMMEFSVLSYSLDSKFYETDPQILEESEVFKLISSAEYERIQEIARQKVFEDLNSD